MHVVLTLTRRDPATAGSTLCPGERLVCISEHAAWAQAERLLTTNRFVGARLLRLWGDDTAVVEAEHVASIGTVGNSD
ncbi:hypothetical protein HND93_12440 [Azospirillum sp. ROY-1-1-2]|uniref:Uncharacterized protein n=2 Tax=Azospirillum oleiclasticum TaxID=2735135 RepID=A0ABX2T873_9PROT|nr:hypothetical protein [Azospirillum oleiclasticum]